MGLNSSAARYRPEIDGLRAVAVLSVIFYHAGSDFFSGGFIGVDVFFVISGFLISGILLNDLQNNRFSLLTFYERRMRRILPALFFMALCVTVACWFYLLPGEMKNFGRSLAAMATFWANILFYKQSGYFDAAAETKPFLHTWSLSVEEQFYIILPLIMAFVFSRRRQALAAVLAGLALISLLLSAVMIGKNPNGVFYLLHFRAWELLAGSLLAVCPGFGKLEYSRPAANLLSCLGLALIMLPAVFYTRNTAFPGLTAVPVVAGSVLLIHLGPRGLMARLLSTRAFTFVGKISYPLYLWHWPLLVIPVLVNMRDLTGGETALALAAALVLSIFSWLVLENPIRSKRILPSRKMIFAVSLIGIVIFVFCGRILRHNDGWPSRFPPVTDIYLKDAKTFWEKSNACLKSSASEDLEPCLLGAPGQAPVFLLWGDSHAAAWTPGLEAIAKEYGLAGLEYDMHSCGPVFGFQNPPSNDDDKKLCLQFNNDLPEVIKKYGIKHVCLAATFGAYIGGRKESASQAIAPSLLKEQLRDTVERLEKMGLTVWVLEGVPEHEFAVPEKLARTLIKDGDIKAAALDVNKYEAFYGPVRAIIESVPGIRPLPISPPICDETYCRAGSDEGSFYSDFNHLSVFGSKHFKDTFRPMMEEIARELPETSR